MADEGFKRKLTAILSADVEGYSRLMGDDEEATVRTLTSYREVLSTLIRQHNGKVLDSPGDNLLAEFVSVVDAVQCAVAVQKEISARNNELPESRRMQFRIGINLGDVILEEGRIYGDGVNIAARLEGLAEPGGICISKTAFDHIESKLPYGYDFIGDQTVKNIAKPVGAYRVLMDPRITVSGKPVEKKAVSKRRIPILVGAVALIVLAVAVGVWKFYAHRQTVEPASKEKMSYPLPDKPSIVVLPFDNLSKEPDQDYIVDGITDQVITGLSNIPYMFVIAKESSLSYKNKDVEVRQISEDLGVQYVLEGSVQVAGNRIRITAQLIDALSGHHRWSERYDRELSDIFELQDDIMANIVHAMQLKVAGLAILEDRPKPKWEAYLKILRAIKHVYRWTKDDNALGRKLYEEAIAIDSDYGPAYRLLGWTYRHDAYNQWSDSFENSLKKAEEMANEAISLGDNTSANILLSDIYSLKGEYDKAVVFGELALNDNPNMANFNALFSNVLSIVGRYEEAITMIKKAIRLNPKHQPWYIYILGLNYYRTDRYEEAISSFKKVMKSFPTINIHIFMVASYNSLGREQEALESAKMVLELDPKFSIQKYMKVIAVKSESDTKRTIEALRKTGLPEHPSLQLPDKPSIAVLPFDNLSGDSNQDYLSDGITDQIIAGLSKIPYMFVIAKESSSSYKGKHVKVQQISKELGVRYVIEGSVLKSGDRLRITAQLIDATTGHHLWSERYDRILDDLFAILDDITMNIMQAMQLKVAGLAIKVNQHKPPFDAYLKILEAIKHVYRFNKEDNLQGRKLYEEAIHLDPEYIDAYRLLGWTYIHDVNHGWSESPAKSLEKAEELAQKALSLGDESIPYLFAEIYHVRGQLDKAIETYENGYAKNSTFANYNYDYAKLLSEMDRHEEALTKVKKAKRLNPQVRHGYNYGLGRIYINAGRCEEGVSALKKALQLYPKYVPGHCFLIYGYICSGREEEARETAKEVLKLAPKFSSMKFANQVKNKQHRKQLIDALRKSGLPE
jgi:adenylate cyclase